MNKRKIVITGASSGIGAATARRFAKEGYSLILLARRRDKLENLKKELIDTDVSIFELDVTSRSSVEQVFEKIHKDTNSIDILINNAGGAFGLDLAQKANLDDWEKCIDVNIKGLLYCTHQVLPLMVKQNRGHIINLGSVAGQYPYPGGNVYGGVKAFVHQFSQNLKADLLGTNVRVSCIEPGLTSGTEFSEVRFHGDKEKAQKVYERTQPLVAEDIAETIFFCCNLPPHVNINTLEVMPTAQAFSSLAIYRT